jgi:beta-phosphoglucomutase-like phosphatase (HAD superfamily)
MATQASPIKALLFGSIGVMMETSDVQRRAYNQAMKEAGLNWEWNIYIYSELLTQSGGKDRLAMLAAATGQHLTPEQVDMIHTRKTEIACAELENTFTPLRPGVGALIQWAKDRSIKTAFVTTTYLPNIDAIFATSKGALSRDDFDYVCSREDVRVGKPDPEAYLTTLQRLGVSADQAVALEDTAVSVMSSKRAGIRTIATPGALTADQDLWQADLALASLADEKTGEIDPRVLAMLGLT